MSYSYPISDLNSNPPRSFVYSSASTDALVLDSKSSETRLRFVNSNTLSNLTPSFTLSSSNELFSIIKNSTIISDYNLDSNNKAILNVYGSLLSSNITISQPNNYKSVVLQDYNPSNLSQFAGFGFSNNGLNYQVPTISSAHIFGAGLSNSNIEWLRIQQNSYGHPQLSIGASNSSNNSNLLVVGGNAFIDGVLTVTSNLFTSKISSPTSYVDFSGKDIINTGTFGFSNLFIQSISSPTGNVSFSYNNVLDIDQLIVRSNITVLSTGLNTYSNLPLNVAFTDPNTGKLNDAIISSNIPRLQQNGLINPTQLPYNSPSSALFRSFNKVGLGIRDPLQLLHVNGNQCITRGFLGVGITNPESLLHIYDDNNNRCSLLIQNVGSTDAFQVYGSNNTPLFNINSTFNIGIRNPAPLYTLDVTGIIHATQGIRANFIDSDTKTIDCKLNTLDNIYNLSTNSLVNKGLLTSSNINTQIIKTGIIAATSGLSNINMDTSLHITGYDTGLFNSSYTVATGDVTNKTYIGLKVDQSAMAKCFLTVSDERVKTEISDSKTYDNLEKIKNINIKNYKFIDSPRFSQPIKGFIAQELEKIIPSAVKTTVSAIPSINDYIIPHTCYSIHITKFPVPSKIYIGQYYKFLDENKSEYIRKITKIEYPYVEFNEALLVDRKNRIFIYGEIVNDFKLINAENLLPYIVGAIQELSEKIANIEDKTSSIISISSDDTEMII